MHSLAAWPSGLLLRAVGQLFRSRAEQSTGPWRRSARARSKAFVATDIATATRRCREILTGIGQERPIAQSLPGVTIIEVVTPSTRRSSGTVLRTELSPARGGTAVEITGWPGAQLVDWGESKRLVEFVTSRLAESPLANGDGFGRDLSDR
jgi:hypothetical protein